MPLHDSSDYALVLDWYALDSTNAKEILADLKRQGCDWSWTWFFAPADMTRLEHFTHPVGWEPPPHMKIVDTRTKVTYG